METNTILTYYPIKITSGYKNKYSEKNKNKNKTKNRINKEVPQLVARCSL